jgi:diguanylate cyclase (GGDEF)-like protein
VTAALAFQSITVGHAHIMVAWRTGIDPASYGWHSFVAARLAEACASARRSVRAESPLRYIWIQSYAFGSANLHDQSLRVLRRGARANHSSRVGGSRGMVALDEFWPKSVVAIRSITMEVVAAIFTLASLSSLLIALRVSVVCASLSASELWPIILSVSAAPTILIGLIIAIRIRRALTRLKITHEELVSLAMIDRLTGLLNRPGFDAVAAEAFEEARRSGQPVSALVCDIDAFRGLNDRYEYDAGDFALRNLAEELEEVIGRRSLILGRQGGDEFVLLLPGIDLKNAVTIAEDVCEACEARALVQQEPAAKFTISVGVGTEASGASELGGLLLQTDAALYRAKRAGGNQVASGPGRFVRRQSAPDIKRVPMRSAKPFAPFN